MFCFCKNKSESPCKGEPTASVVGDIKLPVLNVIDPPSAENPAPSSSDKKSGSKALTFGFGGSALGFLLAFGHAPICAALSTGGVASVVFGGWSVFSWCTHHHSDTPDPVPLTRLREVPLGIREFSKDAQEKATERLLFHQPGFALILDSHKAMAPLSEVKLRFVEDLRGDVFVTIRGRDSDCQNDGAGTKVFLVGSIVTPYEEEQYRGQFELLATITPHSIFSDRAPTCRE